MLFVPALMASGGIDSRRGEDGIKPSATAVLSSTRIRRPVVSATASLFRWHTKSCAASSQMEISRPSSANGL